MIDQIISSQASKYLLDPLTAPEPSQETGPGTHYRSTFADNISEVSASSSKHKNKPSVDVREKNYPSPPKSASPRHNQFPSHQGSKNPWSQWRSYDQQSTVVPTSTAPSTAGREEGLDRPLTEIPSSTTHTSARARGNSLSSRFPGDQSHRPLEIIRKETKAAHRAPHLRKKYTVGPDTIDKLDVIGGRYHHDGPFDATLLARNLFTNSPVEALSGSNEEALKATPRERIKDSIERHRPLDGVAAVPSGMTDRNGNTYDYEEGTDLMIEGNYKRWPGVVSEDRLYANARKADSSQKYLPEDLKGKGEPSYSIEKALKEQKQHRRGLSEGENGIEMATRNRPRANSAGDSHPQMPNYSEWEGQMRGGTSGRKGSGGLVKRFASLRKRDKDGQ